MSAPEEAGWARDFITKIVAACPKRMPTSDDERRAHAMIRAEMETLGLETEVHDFTFNRDLYATLALHFGLGLLGSVVAGRAPLAGFALHAVSAASYALDSSHKAMILRRLFPFRPSQNVLGTLRAEGKPRRRIVFLAHTDAAFTGKVFDPELVKRFAGKPGPLYKSLRLTTAALVALAALDLVQLAGKKSPAISVLRAILSVPTFAAAALNADVVRRGEIVPGAMDDLSGVAGMLLLAKRLKGVKPRDVELVFVATGCEEAGLGGARALAKDRAEVWSKDDTVIIGMDGFANGDLCWFEEGEIFDVPLSPWLEGELKRTTASSSRFAEVAPFPIPVGGTDAIPFAIAGWPAVTLGCVDRTRNMPRHYHWPTDTPENLEADKIPFCVDYAESLTRSLWATAESHSSVTDRSALS
jgi:hypothetical protein